MPYLTAKRKKEIDNGGAVKTPGDLTYAVTMVVLHSEDALWEMDGVIGRYVLEHPDMRYANYCTIIGAITASKMEYIRRTENPSSWVPYLLDEFLEDYYQDVIAPYEDTKIEENGDVYE